MFSRAFSNFLHELLGEEHKNAVGSTGQCWIAITTFDLEKKYNNNNNNFPIL